MFFNNHENQNRTWNDLFGSRKNTVKKGGALIQMIDTFDKENLNLNNITVRKNTQNNQEDKTELFCINHGNRAAEYIVKVENEILTYCFKCGASVASHGFDVQKISNPQKKTIRFVQDNPSSHRISASQTRQFYPSNKEQIQRQKHHQLSNLASSLKSLKGQYIQKSQHLTQVSLTFSNQKQILNNYYNQLIFYIQQIRGIHLQAVEQSSINTIQVCDIQKGQIQQTIEEIDAIVSDIENNINKIVSKVDQHSYNQCFNFYKQKEGFFSHRLEELGAEAKAWPCSTEEEISGKIEEFKCLVNQLHEVGDSSEPNNIVESVLYQDE